jgi:hypothetical protein
MVTLKYLCAYSAVGNKDYFGAPVGRSIRTQCCLLHGMRRMLHARYVVCYMLHAVRTGRQANAVAVLTRSETANAWEDDHAGHTACNNTRHAI